MRKRRSLSPEPAWKRRPVARRWWPILGRFPPGRRARLGQQIARLGVDAVSAITPWFVPLKREELINHYTAIADALSVPLFLYKHSRPHRQHYCPGDRAASWPATRYRSAIKDSAGSYDSLKGFLDAVRDIDGFDVLNGPDSAYPSGICRRLLGLHLGACQRRPR